MRRLRVGIAGLGRIGKFHAETLAHHAPSAELVRVADVRGDVTGAVAEELGVESSTSFDEIIGDPVVEAVVIATPTPTHAEMIHLAAEAGKHIFCEKPLAVDRQESLKAIEAADSQGVKLQVGMHRRFDPDWSAAAERISSGELGDVYLFSTSLRDMHPQPREYVETAGSFFVDVTIHDLDTARWLAGEVAAVTAFGSAVADPSLAEIGQIDTALVVLRFETGALGVIDNARAAGYGYECSTEIMGSRATVRIGRHRRTSIEWLESGLTSVDWVQDFVEQFEAAYRRELEAFAEAVLSDGEIGATGEDALAAFVLAQAAERSLEDGRPVRLSRSGEGHRVFYEILDD